MIIVGMKFTFGVALALLLIAGAVRLFEGLQHSSFRLSSRDLVWLTLPAMAVVGTILMLTGAIR